MSATFAVEPLVPKQTPALLAATDRVIRNAAKLEGLLPVDTRRALAPTIRAAHTYYSNLIEGHDSTLRDLADATTGRWSRERARRAVQQEAAAHLAVLKWQDDEWESASPPRPTDPAVLAAMHRRFYEHMPPEFQVVTVRDSGREADVGPGEGRTERSTVAGHQAPVSEDIAALLEHFDARYRPDALSPGPERLLAAAASHHRLLWIHPFRDGNGRVARLFTDGYLRSISLDAGGMWTTTRGFARDRTRYYAELGAADAERLHGADGRGARSERALEQWCAYFLDVCDDQLRFMVERLSPEVLIGRIAGALQRDRALGIGRSHANAARLLGTLVRRGSLTKTEAYRSLGKSERTGRALLNRLRHANWVREVRSREDGRQVFVSAAIPLVLLPVVIPDLFPPSALDGLDALIVPR